MGENIFFFIFFCIPFQSDVALHINHNSCDKGTYFVLKLGVCSFATSICINLEEFSSSKFFQLHLAEPLISAIRFSNDP